MSRSLPAALALSVLIVAPAFAAPKDDAARIVAPSVHSEGHCSRIVRAVVTQPARFTSA